MSKILVFNKLLNKNSLKLKNRNNVIELAISGGAIVLMVNGKIVHNLSTIESTLTAINASIAALNSAALTKAALLTTLGIATYADAAAANTALDACVTYYNTELGKICTATE